MHLQRLLLFVRLLVQTKERLDTIESGGNSEYLQLFFIRYPSYKRLTAWQCTYLYFCRFVNNGLVKLVKTCWIYSSSFNKSAGHLNVLNTMFLVPSRVNYNKDLIYQPFFWIKLLYASDKCTAWVSGDYSDDGKHWSTGFLTGNYRINSLISDGKPTLVLLLT